MQRYTCTNCGQEVYFDNVVCERCGSALGFDCEQRTMLAMQPVGTSGALETKGIRPSRKVRYCKNSSHGVCNWLVPAENPDALCRACGLNKTIPDLSIQENVEAWGRLERAKKRLICSLQRLGLPLEAPDGNGPKLGFEFMVGATTGHADGLITINVAEANSVERERQRTALEEPYRTLLGHMRHESGHFYWALLVAREPRLKQFRNLFGDEREDYAAALARHHASGTPGDWGLGHVSAYASAHPWEDWAESWAHYLHMVDVLDTALARGTFLSDWASLDIPQKFDPYNAQTMKQLIGLWIPLTLTLNALNRSMGHQDFYPFVLSTKVVEKLAFVHEVVRSGRQVAAKSQRRRKWWP